VIDVRLGEGGPGVVDSGPGTQMMTPPARRGLLDDMENFVRQQLDDQVTRPIVVTLTTATVT
jgi:hypothetical protein